LFAHPLRRQQSWADFFYETGDEINIEKDKISHTFVNKAPRVLNVTPPKCTPFTVFTEDSLSQLSALAARGAVLRRAALSKTSP